MVRYGTMESGTRPCPSCGRENKARRRFCGGCGAALPVLCPACGEENEPDDQFCGGCGEPLGVTPATATRPLPSLVPATPAQPPPLPPEERRLLTAVFCDLAGFTPLSERLDPEEIREFQGRYFAALNVCIERFGGKVEKYAGDAVLALFGAPVAHEDDAERAVLCCLAMLEAMAPVGEWSRERWRVEPELHIGVNTGEVISGSWSVSQETAVTGDAINTAARLEAVAAPGEVLVGEETMRLTRRRIRYGERRDLVLKGKSGTVPAWPALGVRDQLGERWEEREHVAPLIGRESELAGLLRIWAHARGGDGALVTLIGEAGVGKSRLCAELLDRIVASDGATVIRARCLSYGQSISFWLLTDLLRSLFGIGEQESTDTVEKTLRDAVAEYLSGAGDDTRDMALDVLGEVLGLPPGGSSLSRAGAEVRRQALVRALRLLMRALTEREPAILLLEDLHWIDDASAEVLTEVMSDVPGLPMLVLVTQRGGWSPPWAEWTWPERMTLRQLGEGDAAVLAGAVLGGVRLSPALETYLAERAGGNPFFVEELLRALEEAGGLERRDGTVDLVAKAAERLPTTLTEILLARLDRLEGEVRTIAQIASVIGRSFALRLLARVMEREAAALELPLGALQRAEIAFPGPGADPEYIFKHVTLQEVAYNTLLQRRRQELHFQTARAIAALYPPTEYVEVIAYHYSRTEEHAEAAVWLERAGDRAAAMFANDSAISQYVEAERRLKRTGAEPVALARLDEKLGGSLFTAGRYDEAIEALDRAACVYRNSGDLEGAGRATARMGMAHRSRGTPEEGLGEIERILELFPPKPSAAYCELQLTQAALLMVIGSYREALEVADVRETAQVLGSDALLGLAEERRGTALLFLGRTEEALGVLQKAIPLVEAGGDVLTLARALGNVAVAAERTQGAGAAIPYYAKALELAERLGNPDQTAFLRAQLGSAFTMTGQWEEARAHLERAQELVHTGRSTATASSVNLYLGQLALRSDDLESARRTLEEALRVAESADERYVREGTSALLAELDILTGDADGALLRLQRIAGEDSPALGYLLPTVSWSQLELGQVEAAAETADRALVRAREAEERDVLVHALWAQAMVLVRTKHYEEAASVAEEGIRLAESMPYPYYEAKLRVLGGMAAMGAGNVRKGETELAKALRVFRELGAKRDAEEIERSLSVARH